MHHHELRRNVLFMLESLKGHDDRLLSSVWRHEVRLLGRIARAAAVENGLLKVDELFIQSLWEQLKALKIVLEDLERLLNDFHESIVALEQG
jgi:hypothetical protein